MRTPHWQPGQTFGPPQRPDEYELLEYVTTGGEGEVWKANRKDRDGQDVICAVKVLDPDSDIDDWTRRWQDTVDYALTVKAPRLLCPRMIEGKQPHPRGGASTTDCLFLVTPWQEAVGVEVWAARSAAPPVERLNVLIKFCETVDALHAEGWVHRDISGGNVMVDAVGDPLLIDLTSLRQQDRSLSLFVSTDGYSDGGEHLVSGGRPSVPKDRLAVGVLARVLLLPHERLQKKAAEVAAAAPDQLARAGYSPAVTDCLTDVLAEGGGAYGGPLTEWARRLADIVAREPDRSQVCLGAGVDAHGRPVAVTGGDRGLRWYSPAGDVPAGLSAPGEGPCTARDLALVRDGMGRLVAAVVEGSGMLWTGIEGTHPAWQSPLPAGVRGVAALVSSAGETLVWTGTATGITLLTLPCDGFSTSRTVAAPALSRVLAATWDADGAPALLVTDTDGVWHWTWPLDGEPDRVRLLSEPAAHGSIALNRSWGELEAWVRGEDGFDHHLSRHHSGSGWGVLGTSPQSGGHTILHSVHQGVVRLAGTPAGVVLATESSTSTAEHTLHGAGQPGPLALHQDRSGAVQVAAVVDGELRYWAETWAQQWIEVSLRPR